jgi:hypothetical protein
MAFDLDAWVKATVKDTGADETDLRRAFHAVRSHNWHLPDVEVAKVLIGMSCWRPPRNQKVTRQDRGRRRV